MNYVVIQRRGKMEPSGGAIKKSWLILEKMCSARRHATPLTSLVLAAITQSKSHAAGSRGTAACELMLRAFPLL